MELEHARQQTAQLTSELAELRQQQALDREGVQAELRQLRLAVERPSLGIPVAHEHSPAQVVPCCQPNLLRHCRKSRSLSRR